jgi:hypothetical protein
LEQQQAEENDDGGPPKHPKPGRPAIALQLWVSHLKNMRQARDKQTVARQFGASIQWIKPAIHATRKVNPAFCGNQPALVAGFNVQNHLTFGKGEPQANRPRQGRAKTAVGRLAPVSRSKNMMGD